MSARPMATGMGAVLKRRRPIRFLAGLAAAMLVLTACGADDETDEAAEDDPTEEPADTDEPEDEEAATAFPEGDITMIVPLDAGGGTDLLARELAAAMADELGVNVIVENQPGGGTVLGLENLASADPDGQTLMLIGTTIASVRAAGLSDLGPDDFTVVGVVNADPPAITASAEEFADIDEFLEFARTNPDDVRVATGNPDGVFDVTASVLRDEGDLPWRPVPTEGGAAPSVTLLLSGEVEATTVSVPELLEHVESGTLEVLAVGATERLTAVPDAPTFAEAGLPNPPTVFRPVLAPAGLPADVLEVLEEAVLSAAQSDRYQSFLENNDFGELTLGADEGSAYVDEQQQLYESYFADAG